jgi:hypothetical protein
MNSMALPSYTVETGKFGSEYARWAQKYMGVVG